MLTEPTGNKAAVAFSDIPSEVVNPIIRITSSTSNYGTNTLFERSYLGTFTGDEVIERIQSDFTNTFNFNVKRVGDGAMWCVLISDVYVPVDGIYVRGFTFEQMANLSTLRCIGERRPRSSTQRY